MKFQIGTLALCASAASAQLLTQGNGNLPACGQTCSTLTTAQQQCNGASSTSLTAWSCFCKNVWSSSNGALTTMCASSCTAVSDNTQIEGWYTANCGSDNGASEHGGSSGNTAGTGTGTTGNTGSSSVVPSNLPSTTAASGSYVSGEDTQGCTDWWSCHWKWVVMVIVVAVGLLILGFGGRWLKKRHDRKQDRMSESFNAGITTRAPQMASNDVNDSRVVSAVDNDPASGRNSPVRTREAFMPYGYGYTRSESRLGSYNNNNDRRSPLARGATPVNELEKNVGMPPSSEQPESGPRKKSRRVLVRERSTGADSSEREKR